MSNTFRNLHLNQYTMKKVLLTLVFVAMAMVSTIAQTKFRISKVIADEKLSNGLKDRTTTFPDGMYVTFVGSYVTITDEANSIYKQASEIVDRDTPEYEAGIWDATDENGSRVVCILLVYKATGEVWFSVAYTNVTFLYQLKRLEE